MKLAVFASLLTGPATFAPAQTGKASTALKMAFEDKLGAQPPLGFFDPLGLVTDGDQAKFDHLRYIEIKHGCICMLAIIG
jgi:Chlorophyll A-B binding protein